MLQTNVTNPALTRSMFFLLPDPVLHTGTGTDSDP